MLTKTKSFNLKAIKGAEITSEMLGKINKYTMKTLDVEDIYVRRYLMAHNGVDRDRERFPEDLLDDFSRTLPGKSFLEVHDKYRLPRGRYFDAFTEEMSKEEFKALTGEDIRIPDGIKMAKVVYGLIYLVKADFNDKIIANIEAGVYAHVSIGFSASNLIDIKDDDGQLLYREYVAPGESREGSIVYLGAQQGATAMQKSAGGESSHDDKGVRDIDYSKTENNPLIPGNKIVHESNLSPLWCDDVLDERYNPEWEKSENNLLITKRN